MSVQTGALTSWNVDAARDGVVEFVQRTVSDNVPVEKRLAVFGNDGTSCWEKPMPILARAVGFDVDEAFDGDEAPRPARRR
jgi:hypothetical protein